jgi:hypothetical protein
MSSVSATNPGLTDLLQTLSNVNSPVLSSPAVVSALQGATPRDIVQLSSEATELQNIGVLFGLSNGTTSAPTPLEDLQNVVSASAAPAAAASSASSSGSTTAQLANYQQDLQLQEMQGLLGLTGSGSTGSLVNVTG